MTLVSERGFEKEQWQTWGRKASRFDWATFGWVSCIIDTFVPLVYHWTMLSNLSYNQAYVPGPRFGFKTSLAHQAHITLSGSMSSIDKQGSSLGSGPTSPNPNYNRPSGHWPCVKHCLVGDSGRYLQMLKEGLFPMKFAITGSYFF